VVLATTIVVLWIRPASVHIADGSKPADLQLISRHHLDKVTTLHVEGRGNIDGEGEFTLLLNGQPYKTERVKGQVNFTWRVDWHTTEAVVRYTPLTARSGSITLRYHFAGL
jgi:hypothetical protein